MQTSQDKIITATRELIQKNGFRAITTKRIAEIANISESTVFRLFGDKNTVLREALRFFIPRAEDIDISVLLGEEELSVTLACLIRQYQIAIVKYLPAIRLAMTTQADFVRQDINMVLRPLIHQFAQYLRAQAERNRMIQVDFDALSEMLFSLMLVKAPLLIDAGAELGYSEEKLDEMVWEYAVFLESRLKSNETIASNMLNFTVGSKNRPSDLRGNNLSIILKKFKETEKLSVSEISRDIKLSKTTIIKIFNQLIEDRLLVHLGIDSGSDERGRRPNYYSLNGDYGYCICIEFFPNELYAAMTDLKDRILYVHSMPASDDATFDKTVDLIERAVYEILAHQQVTIDRVLGICVASGGPTDYKDGSVIYVPRFHNWPAHAPLKKVLEKRFPKETHIIINNEMNCQTVGERFFGKAYGKRSALVFEAGEKLGSGIILDNRLFLGAHSLAGEIGHMVLDINSDVQCVCGSYGCFRALVHCDRALHLCREWASRFPDSVLNKQPHDLTIEDLLAAYRCRDMLAEAVMDELAKWMGTALSNIILTYDPEVFVLQGVYTKAGPRFLEAIRGYITRNRFPYLKEIGIDLQYSELGKNAGILGGARLITDHVLQQYCLQFMSRE